jgi:hypothetical protein
MRACSSGVVVGLVVAMTGSMVVAGPDWVETGDAGEGFSTAQAPIGTSGNLNTISGSLAGGFVADFEDCYLIRIVNPAAFSLTITAANFNTQAFLFNITVPGGAYGLLANDDIDSPSITRSRFTNVSNDGTNVVVTLPGDYMIAVTGFNRDPVSVTGAIFNQASLSEVSGPDGPGGFNAHTGWQGQGTAGDYVVTMTGAGFPGLPSPSAGALLMMAGVIGGRRKR